MFDTVLVANRGEIAVRIMRTLRAMGIRSVAIYSEPDRGALHVTAADEAVLVGPADARSSYLAIDRVVAAALASGAQAVHPGYGFLSENADFAEACERAGLVFVGPRSETIRAMGDKRAAKDAAVAAGVPVVPGYHGTGATDAQLEEQATAIGFPLIVKPAAGGGGKGMRVVHEGSDLAEALASARREATSAFGDDALLLERFVAAARHVEVQVVGDGAGRVLHLGDRDCSLQRRHQKVIEEAPAPFLPDATRERMHAEAVAVAASVDYLGVGTVEFVVDAKDPDQYFFLEMNTRLQVEHPVTELVTGLDLVELQLRVAAGEGPPLTQAEVVIRGHAVEARVYAEDGHRGFLPASGTVLAYSVPTDVRVDSGIGAGTVVGTSYDPLLLKVIAHGTDRTTALDALDSALARSAVLGVEHNVGVLRELVAHPRVRDGSMTTSLIGDSGVGATCPPLDDHAVVAAVLAWAEHERALAPSTIWETAGAWRVGGVAPVTTSFVDDGGVAHTVSVLGPLDGCQVAVDGAESRPASLTSLRGSDGRPDAILVELAGVARGYVVAFDGSGSEDVLWLGRGGDAWRLHRPRRDHAAQESGDGVVAGDLRSPMPGAVVLVARAVGDVVREGDVVAVIEAMKMEYRLTAPFDGVVSSIAVGVGAQVVRDQVVAVVTPEETS